LRLHLLRQRPTTRIRHRRLLQAACVLAASAARPAFPGAALYGQAPTSRCSPHGTADDGTSVIRVRLLDASGRAVAANANAAIIELHCGAPVGPDGVAELLAVPLGRHVVPVRALGFPPDSAEVRAGAADTVVAIVHLRRGYRVRQHPDSGSGPSR
jgi:hypothetical protein